MRAVVNGRETALYEKVVVTSAAATIAPQPGGQGEVIEPWAIFFRLYSNDGRAVVQAKGNSYVRVGNSKGRPLGWIRRDHVTSWSTRFVLEPLRPVPGRHFRVALGDHNYAEFKTAVEDKRRFALIVEPPEREAGDDTKYPVVVYAGLVQAEGAAGTIRRERNKIQDLKLEVVFVVESSPMMGELEYGGVTPLDTVRKVARGWVELIRSNPELNGAIRLGLVEFQDATPDYPFISRTSCPLTSDLDRFLRAIDGITPPEEPKDDPWAQDTLAGMQKAVGEAGWTTNSSKHIVVFGTAEPQIYARGQGPNPLGMRARNEIAAFFDRSNSRVFNHGYNTTGLSIQQIIARANPRTGGDVERARNAKTFHSVLVGVDVPRLLDIDDDEYRQLRRIVETITKLGDEGTDDLFQRLEVKYGRKEAIDLFVFAYLVRIYDTMRGRARTAFHEISRNLEVDGLNIAVEPTSAGIRRAIAEIDRVMVDAFRTLGGVRTGRIGVTDLERDANSVTQTYYAIVGAAAEKFKDKPALRGFASVRDENGHEVAHKRVIVSEDELRRLRSTIDAIRTKFQARIRKADRQDVSEILDELKNVTAQTAAGQSQFAADVQLKDVITDLPLRTSALETTPRQLAVMPSDAFRNWLARLDMAVTRADDILAGKNWLVLSSLAENERFTFLRLSELP